MTPRFAAALAVCLLLSPFIARAGAVDPLWQKTVKQVADGRKWVAQDIAMEVFEVGKPGKESIRLHLARWEKGKPVYAIDAQSDPKGELKNEDIGIDALSEMATTMITPQAPVKRSDDQPLHGKNWTLFQLSTSQLGMRFALKIWVDPETGAPHQSESAMRVPLMADMRQETSYDSDPELGARERQSDIQIEKLTPFSGGARLRIVNTPTRWIARPR